jgi:hypothetical protein
MGRNALVRLLRRLRIGVAIAAIAYGCGKDSPSGANGPADSGATGSDGVSSEAGGGLPDSNSDDSSAPGDGDGGTPPNDGAATTDGFSAATPPELTWKAESAASVAWVWGSGSHDVYAVGAFGTIVHSTGDGTWTSQSSGTSARLDGIWGSSANDIYVAPYINAILHSSGDGGWDHQVLMSGYTFDGIWGSGPNDIYTWDLLLHSTGDGQWTFDASNPIQSIEEPVLQIWGSSANDLYAAGDFGHIFHWDGTRMHKNNLGADGGAGKAVFGIAGSGHDDVYVTDGLLHHSTGNDVWTTQAVPIASGDDVEVLWALSKTAVYAASRNGVFLRSGGDGVWVGQTIDPSHPTMQITSIWASSPTDVYVAGAGALYHGTASSAARDAAGD